MNHRRTVIRKRVLAAVSAAGLAAGLAAAGLGIGSAQADTAPRPMTSQALLQFSDIQRAGLAVDDARLGTRGDQYLGDAGRFDEGCLGEKTMRNITSSKAYPAPGDAKAYVDGAWTSTRDKEIWINESVAQGADAASTRRYVKTLLAEIRDVASCEQDPAQGNHYGAGRTATVGTAKVTYFLDYTMTGETDGGGVAVIRDGRRFGYVSLMSATGRPGAVLKRLALAAADNLR